METDIFGYPPVIPHVMAVFDARHWYIALRAWVYRVTHEIQVVVLVVDALTCCAKWFRYGEIQSQSQIHDRMIESFRYMIIYVYN